MYVFESDFIFDLNELCHSLVLYIDAALSFSLSHHILVCLSRASSSDRYRRLSRRCARLRTSDTVCLSQTVSLSSSRDIMSCSVSAIMLRALASLHDLCSISLRIFVQLSAL